jgi:histone H2A
MKEGRLAERISVTAAITLAAVMELLVAEVLELSSENVAERGGLLIIKPRNISLGIKGDEELARLVGSHAIIPTGGVVPYINPDLEMDRPQKLRNRRRRIKQELEA